MRIYNFSPGPAALPHEVLREAAEEMLDWHGSGLSVMEMSHRGREFGEIFTKAEADLRKILQIPENYRVLFMQGGALAENAIVPLNMLRGHDVADYVNTGSWSTKSIREARRYATVNVIASSEGDGFRHIPDPSTWQRSSNAAYVHVCTNETIGGLEFHGTPLTVDGIPIIADMSSHILSRVLDVTGYGLIYAGAQKNIGPAGLTLVIVREDLIGKAHPLCPSAFDYGVLAANGSMYNTPPTYAIYIAGLVFQWLLEQAAPGETALETIEKRNIAKACLLYDALDRSSFYRTHVVHKDRSRMNVPFFLADDRLNDSFLAQAKERGLVQLKGHKSVGGMRASIYNAMPMEGVQALVEFLQDFERSQA